MKATASTQQTRLTDRREIKLLAAADAPYALTGAASQLRRDHTHAAALESSRVCCAASTIISNRARQLLAGDKSEGASEQRCERASMRQACECTANDARLRR